MWSLPTDSFSRYPFRISPYPRFSSSAHPIRMRGRSQRQVLPAPEPHGLARRKTNSLLAPVLRVVVPQTRLRRLLAPFQRRPFKQRQIPQPGKIPPPAARLDELLLESLTFQTAQNTVRIATHGAPVENNEEQATIRAKKKQTLFFVLCSPVGTPSREYLHANRAASRSRAGLAVLHSGRRPEFPGLRDFSSENLDRQGSEARLSLHSTRLRFTARRQC